MLIVKAVTRVYFRGGGFCRVETAKPEWPRRGRVLGDGAVSPLLVSYGHLGSAVSSPSGILGEVPAEIDLGTFLQRAVMLALQALY